VRARPSPQGLLSLTIVFTILGVSTTSAGTAAALAISL
jgi:hypothetical protein